MVSPGNFDGMVDVFDDFRPVHARELPLRHEFPRQLVAFDQLAALFIAAAFLHVLVELFGDLGSGCLAKLLAEESDMVIDLDDAALCRQTLNPLVGYIPWSVAECAAGRVRSEQRRLTRFEGIIKSLVTHVRDIHDHTEAVHLAHNGFAQIREAGVVGWLRGKGRPFIVAPLRPPLESDTLGAIGSLVSPYTRYHVLLSHP